MNPPGLVGLNASGNCRISKLPKVIRQSDQLMCSRRKSIISCSRLSYALQKRLLDRAEYSCAASRIRIGHGWVR